MKFLIAERISANKYKTPEGYLVCVDSVLARTGKQTYRKNEIFVDCNDDTEIEVDRKPEEVFSEATLASFENKPITIEHPDEDVNTSNFRELAVGFVRDIHRGKVNGEDVMLGTLVITDEQAIADVESGQYKELSCGYDCDIEDSTHPEQKNIRGNHIALCERGRAGIARIVDAIKDEKKFNLGWIRRSTDRAQYTEISANTEDEAKKKLKAYYGREVYRIFECKKINDSEEIEMKDKLIDIPSDILGKIESLFKARNIKITGKGKTWTGRVHYQVEFVGKAIDLKKKLDLIEKQVESLKIPMTYAIGNNKEDTLATAGVDFDKLHVDDAVEDEATYSYSFPRFTAEDKSQAARYNLKIVYNSGSETEVHGTLTNLRRFAKEYLAYELHKDYLEKIHDSDINDDKSYQIFVNGVKRTNWTAPSAELAVKEFLHYNPSYANGKKGKVEARDCDIEISDVEDGKNAAENAVESAMKELGITKEQLSSKRKAVEMKISSKGLYGRTQAGWFVDDYIKNYCKDSDELISDDAEFTNYNTLLRQALNDEVTAINIYDQILANKDTPEEVRNQIQEIENDEKDHYRILAELVGEDAENELKGFGDSMKDSYFKAIEKVGNYFSVYFIKATTQSEAEKLAKAHSAKYGHELASIEATSEREVETGKNRGMSVLGDSVKDSMYEITLSYTDNKRHDLHKVTVRAFTVTEAVKLAKEKANTPAVKVESIRFLDSCEVKVDDAIQTFEIRWIDTYKKSKGYGKEEYLHIDKVKGNTLSEALKKLADDVALAGIGTANAMIVSIHSDKASYMYSGKLSELVKKVKDSSKFERALDAIRKISKIKA